MTTTTESPPKGATTVELRQPTSRAVPPPTSRSPQWITRARTVLHWIVDVWSKAPVEELLDTSTHRQHELMRLWLQTR